MNTTGDAWTGPLTPDRDGPTLLTARAADAAGNAAAGSPATYEFLVRTVAGQGHRRGASTRRPAAHRRLRPGRNRPLDRQGRSGRAHRRSERRLRARPSTASPRGPRPRRCVDTKTPFTVTALGEAELHHRERPDHRRLRRTAATGSGFRLQYRPTSLPRSPTPPGASRCTAADGGRRDQGLLHRVRRHRLDPPGRGPRAGTGLRLYVNGLNWEDTDLVPFTSGWSATQGWSVGRAKHAGRPQRSFWTGRGRPGGRLPEGPDPERDQLDGYGAQEQDETKPATTTALMIALSS